MQKGAGTSVRSNRRKYITLGIAVLVVGIIAASLAYRGSITSRITGDVTKESQILTEAEAVAILVDYLNVRYGDAKFFRSEDLGSIYFVVIEHGKQQYNFYITRDGRYFTNSMERIEMIKPVSDIIINNSANTE